jgi:hypothetical protein
MIVKDARIRGDLKRDPRLLIMAPPVKNSFPYNEACTYLLKGRQKDGRTLSEKPQIAYKIFCRPPLTVDAALTC